MKVLNGYTNFFEPSQCEYFSLFIKMVSPPPVLSFLSVLTTSDPFMCSFAKQKQLGITLTIMYLLLGRKLKLSTSNKLLIYKTILKPIWTYGIQLWGTVSTSNIEIL
jgi:hypothetical protein